MTFKKYVDRLNEFLAEHPEYGCLNAAYMDEEGLCFEVYITDEIIAGYLGAEPDHFIRSEECEEEGLPIDTIVVN